MAWTTLRYSVEDIDAAGQFLIGSSAASIYSLNYALEIVNNWRSSHAYPLTIMRIYLGRKSKSIDRYSIVSQRIKRLSSIEYKLDRLNWLMLSRMQDIGGCRSVVSNVNQVETLVDTYHGSRIKHKLVKEDDYIASPRPSGYRSYHLIYSYFSDKKQTHNGLKVEIQLRSRLQHAWATAVETVGAFTRQALKSSQGEKDWLRFFALMSSAIALRERRPMVPGTPEDREQLIAELRNYVVSLDVIARLNTYRIVTRHVDRMHGRARYFLLSLDLNERSVSIKMFRQNQLDEASDAYIEEESRLRGNTGGDAVLVSVESLKSLERAYPNYFLDTSRFMLEVERVIGGT